MGQISKALLAIIICMVMAGCASQQPLTKGRAITLPKRPAPVIMYGKDSKHTEMDTKKFPDAKWIKEPQMDLNKQRGWWSFDDIATISESLGKWEFFYKDVKELTEGQNDLVEGKGKYEKRPWYRFW